MLFNIAIFQQVGTKHIKESLYKYKKKFLTMESTNHSMFYILFCLFCFSFEGRIEVKRYNLVHSRFKKIQLKLSDLFKFKKLNTKIKFHLGGVAVGVAGSMVDVCGESLIYNTCSTMYKAGKNVCLHSEITVKRFLPYAIIIF